MKNIHKNPLFRNLNYLNNPPYLRKFTKTQHTPFLSFN